MVHYHRHQSAAAPTCSATHSVHGIFSNYLDHDMTHFFSRPSYSAGCGIDGCFKFLPIDAIGFNKSLHYEVFLIPDLPEIPTKKKCHKGPLVGKDATAEWPPSVHTLWVFSSRTGRWEDKAFLHEGHATNMAGTSLEVLLDSPDMMSWGPRFIRAEYWNGALYVHFQGSFVMRLSILGAKYRVIKTPRFDGPGGYT
uniref:Uncharacterized protein n=1 Tax=Oryza rufipogon TaxID=4529 RepID=A0A0E0QFV3_ORYRU